MAHVGELNPPHPSRYLHAGQRRRPNRSRHREASLTPLTLSYDVQPQALLRRVARRQVSRVEVRVGGRRGWECDGMSR